ncbi:MAG TPA: permease [Acidimicrobiales bacterium]|nr:permease [Acidimicrobiales bacterium]
MTVLDDIGRSLREGLFMFWQTLWPLILGFGLSGVVQAFVSRRTMQRAMGDHRPAAVARATGFGMVSSSCSYSASAMAKSMVAKGADFLTAMVFMFASTNLVIELGIVLVVLMGWQFAASEFVGGAIMIVLLVVVGGLFLAGRTVERARRRLADDAGDGHGAGHGDGGGCHGGSDPAPSPRRQWREKGKWADAATYSIADLTMLRKELVIGYTVAGFLAVLVPTDVWNDVFVHGHGFWTSLENVVVGPFIAVVSFVCSIGNVPLAAALWNGGISFGGVVSFIFADLITFPLLLVYRRYYGTRLTLRMLAVFWGVMSLAGLATEGIFRAAGLVPTDRSVQVAGARFSWDYTTWLNIVFLVLLAVMYWAYRNRERLGGGDEYALDPVCGMQVRKAEALATRTVGGRRHYFCSDHCAERFSASRVDADP